jgi:hypothetical protein
VPAQAGPPHLREQGTAKRLLVGGAPFPITGGELSNSAASSEAWIASHQVRLRARYLNTVLAPVSWERLEPEEGRLTEPAQRDAARSARQRSQAGAAVVRRVEALDVDLHPFVGASATLADDSRAFAALMAVRE